MKNKISKFKQALRTKKGKRIFKLSILGLVLLLVGAWMVITIQHAGRSLPVTAQQTATVTRGTLTKTIEGNGTIAAINQYDVTSLVNGEILSDHFEEGQAIEKGTLMYQIDASELQNSLEKSNTALQRAQMTYQKSVDSAGELSISAPISGVITELLISEGESASENTPVATIADKSYMRLSLPFNAADAEQLYSGQSASVSIAGVSGTLPGTIDKVGTGSLTNDSGAPITMVEILVPNPGSIRLTDKATAIAGGIACNAAGTFTYAQQETVLSNATGQVTDLPCQKGDAVSAGSVLARLQNRDVSDAVRENQLLVNDARIDLQNTQRQLENYRITAPISGKVVKKTSKAGDKLDNSNTNTVMATIADLSTLVVDININEMDILSVSVGQTVEITADAIDGQTFTGYVQNIDIMGQSNEGVTTYPVKIYIENAEGSELYPGMNVSAKIMAGTSENILMVPLNAVDEGNTVLVQKADGTTEARQVTLGVYDSDFIEITSGLQEGETVVLTDKLIAAASGGIMR